MLTARAGANIPEVIQRRTASDSPPAVSFSGFEARRVGTNDHDKAMPWRWGESMIAKREASDAMVSPRW